MLNEYLQQVRRFLRDGNFRLLNEEDLVSYVNRARREVAMRSQCIRITPPISGQVMRVHVTNAGSGYTAPVVTISAPDSPGGTVLNPAGLQATATAQFIGGEISNISVTNGGDGYFQPSATIADPTGTGATLSVETTPLSILSMAQESYRFSDFPLTVFQGVKSVFAVLEVAVIYSNYRYVLVRYPWSRYQAVIRNYPRQYYYVPAVCSQFGDGEAGKLFLYPIASQAYQVEFDCLCLPMDLIDNTSFEAIPAPWTDAVPYFAASLAYAELQNFNASRYYDDQYAAFVRRYGVYARPGWVASPYGRT